MNLSEIIPILSGILSLLISVSITLEELTFIHKKCKKTKKKNNNKKVLLISGRHPIRNVPDVFEIKVNNKKIKLNDSNRKELIDLIKRINDEHIQTNNEQITIIDSKE